MRRGELARPGRERCHARRVRLTHRALPLALSERCAGQRWGDMSWRLLAELPSRLENATHGESGRDTGKDVGFLEPRPR